MSRVLRVVHIASGDLWACAEVQAYILMSRLAQTPGAEIPPPLMNGHTLAWAQK
jgi:hypothetical protein